MATHVDASIRRNVGSFVLTQSHSLRLFRAQREKIATSPSLQASASMTNVKVPASIIRKSTACSQRSSSLRKEHHSISEVCTAASEQTVSGLFSGPSDGRDQSRDVQRWAVQVTVI